MADVSIIVAGGGVSTGTPFTLNALAYVSATSPPTIVTFAAQRLLDGAVPYLAIANSAGVYPVVAGGATETLRVNGGAIILGSAADTVQIGRAAVANTTQAVVIGATATNAGNAGVVIGFGAAFSLAGGVAIGVNAAVSGNAGGATGIAIGGAASAVNSSAGAGDSLAIGTNAVARTNDVVVGGNASSSVQNVLGNNNTVVGNGATANIGQGASTVIGALSTGNFVNVTICGQGSVAGVGNGTIVGQASSTTAAGTQSVIVGRASIVQAAQNIILGNGLTSALANTGWFGAPSTDIQTLVIGAGDTIASPAARTIRFTNASGVDNAAGNLTIIAPRSTGAATVASIIFQTGVVGGSGAAVQTATTQLTISGLGITVAGTSTFAQAVTISAGGLTITSGGLVVSTNGITAAGPIQLGGAAATDLITIGGTAYGAGVASIRLNGLSTAAVNNQVGTLTNAPVAGNPTFWMPVSIAGVIKYSPLW
jgi:hypothetical protein